MKKKSINSHVCLSPEVEHTPGFRLQQMLLAQVLQYTCLLSLACEDYFLLVVLPALQMVKQTLSFSIHGMVVQNMQGFLTSVTYRQPGGVGSLCFGQVFCFKFSERDLRLILYRFMLF